MQTEFYRKYMRSKEWEDKKQERMRIDNYSCVTGSIAGRCKFIISHIKISDMKMYTQIYVPCVALVTRNCTTIMTESGRLQHDRF